MINETVMLASLNATEIIPDISQSENYVLIDQCVDYAKATCHEPTQYMILTAVCIIYIFYLLWAMGKFSRPKMAKDL